MTTWVMPLTTDISGVGDGALRPAEEVAGAAGSSEVHDTNAAITKTAMVKNLIFVKIGLISLSLCAVTRF